MAGDRPNASRFNVEVEFGVALRSDESVDLLVLKMAAIGGPTCDMSTLSDWTGFDTALDSLALASALSNT
jgi:hypothetical protein